MVHSDFSESLTNLDQDTRLSVLKLYVIPIITYAGTAWAHFVSNAQWLKLDVVQTIGVRLQDKTAILLM